MPIHRRQYLIAEEFEVIMGYSLPDMLVELGKADEDNKLDRSNLMFIKESEYIDEIILPNEIPLIKSTEEYEDNLRIAVANQVDYVLQNGDFDFVSRDSGFSLGKFKIAGNSSARSDILVKKQRRLSPSARRYLLNGGYLYRGVKTKWE